jgi:hypothetical protein
MRALIYSWVLLLWLPSQAWAVDPAPLPKELQDAKVVFIVNQGAENSVLDNVYDQFKKWPRWTLTTDREKADIFVVLSARNYFLGMINMGGTTNTTVVATNYGGTTVAQGSSTTTPTTSVPVLSYPRYLTVINARTGNELIGVSCELRLSKGRTARILVDRLKERFPKSER